MAEFKLLHAGKSGGISQGGGRSGCWVREGRGGGWAGWAAGLAGGKGETARESRRVQGGFDVEGCRDGRRVRLSRWLAQPAVGRGIVSMPAGCGRILDRKCCRELARGRRK
ncbi:hypothetical protein KFK09_029100 [Dendrobium nobile]|uniref:Uncharacterized protein n=1 Tax=Dendrobium nobile TaxID=94219 RepID=A0A8T3A4B2_DENNO|nr:hypothetical protein KFK09_029100 [Dendrobium nobile]